MHTDKKLPLTPILAFLMLACAGYAAPQAKPAMPVKTPSVVAEFLKAAGPQPDGEVMLKQAKETLWIAYTHDESLKGELIAYVRSAPDGPGLAFAGIALIPFHDPATVKPLMDRALDRRTSDTTRWYFLNAAPYILAMGDVFYQEDGKLDREAREMAAELIRSANLASQNGLGRFHASELREIFDKAKSSEDYDLAVWHGSAYLIGTLDLRDRDVLAPIFIPDTRALPNLIASFSQATNSSYHEELLAASPAEITREKLNAVSAQILDRWKAYLGKYPSGDWVPAVVGSFREAGYEIEEDMLSQKSLHELRRAMDDKSETKRYSAYRLLNHIFKTHFDLERIFNADKYALSFLEPAAGKAQTQQRLKKYWQERLAAPSKQN